MPRDEYQYIAFISYRHEAVGRKWAMWLQSAIENYRVPWALVKLGKAPRRVGKCFRDEEELAASSDLSKEIDAALQASKFLIVVCTPRTPHSKWVNEEIQRFRDLGRGDRILSLLVEGDPREAFPPALMEIRPSATADTPDDVPYQQIEPLAADIREEIGSAGGHGRGHMRSMAKLRIIAGLLGVSFDDLYDRNSRRVYGRMLVTAGFAVLIAATMIALAVYAFAQRSEAQAQRQRAEKERDTAKFIGDFLLDDVLAGANPDNMPDKNVRDQIIQRMIDPAADSVESKFRERPLVEAEVRDRLGRVYEEVGAPELGLPQFRKAKELGEKHLPEGDVNRASFVNNYAARLRRAGRLDEAEELFRQTLAISRRTLGDDHIDTIRSITNLGQVVMLRGKMEEAEQLSREGYERARKTCGEDDLQTSYAAERYAAVLNRAGKKTESLRLLREVVDIRRRKLGADNTDTLSAMYNLASLLTDQGEVVEAEERCREVIPERIRILGNKHPDTLTALNLYAEILLRMGAAAEAEPIAAFVVKSVPAAASTRAKVFALTWAASLDRLNRPDDAQRVRRDYSLPAPPVTTQPASRALRPLEGEPARFVQQLLADLKIDSGDST